MIYLKNYKYIFILFTPQKSYNPNTQINTNTYFGQIVHAEHVTTSSLHRLNKRRTPSTRPDLTTCHFFRNTLPHKDTESPGPLTRTRRYWGGATARHNDPSTSGGLSGARRDARDSVERSSWPIGSWKCRKSRLGRSGQCCRAAGVGSWERGGLWYGGEQKNVRDEKVWFVEFEWIYSLLICLKKLIDSYEQ